MIRFLRRYGLTLVLVLALVTLATVPLVTSWLTPAESYPKTNYTLIEDGLYLGGILSGPPPGTDAVLNVCETRDPYRADHHKWSPIPDAAPAPSLDWLREQVAFVAEQRQEGRTVFVHCRAGVSRSATVTAAYLMARDGLSRDDALARLRAKRSRIGPNPAFLRLLAEWEAMRK